jgi:hypothetical protein
VKLKKPIESLIVAVRGQKVILDADLAALYDVATKVLNQAANRNASRFPDDFRFRLTLAEAGEILRSRSQIVTLKRGGNIKYLPWAFTEHGALQAANILRSRRAVEMSLYVIRAFVRMREELAANSAILKQLAEIDKALLQHDSALTEIWMTLQPLLEPMPDPPEPDKGKIGFNRENEK